MNKLVKSCLVVLCTCVISCNQHNHGSNMFLLSKDGNVPYKCSDWNNPEYSTGSDHKCLLAEEFISTERPFYEIFCKTEKNFKKVFNSIFVPSVVVQLTQIYQYFTDERFMKLTKYQYENIALATSSFMYDVNIDNSITDWNKKIDEILSLSI